MNAYIYRVGCFLGIACGISSLSYTHMYISSFFIGMISFAWAGYGWQKAEDERG